MGEQGFGQVVVLAHTPEPEKICAAAASISTTKGSALEIYHRRWEKEKAEKLIRNVLGLGHETTIEHVSFTLAFENVSAFVEQFMIEFRLASFTVKSRRYVDFSQMGYYQPHFRFKKAVSEKEQKDLTEKYNAFVQELFAEYEFLLQKGVPREDARFLLPYSYHSNFYCTVNARELKHIIQAALTGRGQKYPEIKALGESLWAQAQKIAPAIFTAPAVTRVPGKEAQLRQLLAEIDLTPAVLSPREQGQAGMGQTFCELLAFPADPESLVAVAVLVKHTSGATGAAQEIIAKNKVLRRELLQLACTDKRQRELEQVWFTWRINNLSLAGLTHLARHRLQSLNVPSFTEMSFKQGYRLPVSVREKAPLRKRYVPVWAKQRELAQELREKGVYPEDLVYLFLSGNLTDVVTTMNGRELFHFLRLRTCQRAQWEIRAIAEEMLFKLRTVAPGLFRYFGPSCYAWGKCPEGKLACGREEAMVQKFNPV